MTIHPHIPPVNTPIHMIIQSITTWTCEFHTQLRSPTFPVQPAQEIGGLRSLKRSLRFSFFLGLNFRRPKLVYYVHPSNPTVIQQNLVVNWATKPTYLSRGVLPVWVCLKWCGHSHNWCLRIMSWWPHIKRNKNIIGQSKKRESLLSSFLRSCYITSSWIPTFLSLTNQILSQILW